MKRVWSSLLLRVEEPHSSWPTPLGSGNRLGQTLCGKPRVAVFLFFLHFRSPQPGLHHFSSLHFSIPIQHDPGKRRHRQQVPLMLSLPPPREWCLTSHLLNHTFQGGAWGLAC